LSRRGFIPRADHVIDTDLQVSQLMPRADDPTTDLLAGR
jgi:hypothetical protein